MYTSRENIHMRQSLFHSKESLLLNKAYIKTQVQTYLGPINQTVNDHLSKLFPTHPPPQHLNIN